MRLLPLKAIDEHRLIELRNQALETARFKFGDRPSKENMQYQSKSSNFSPLLQGLVFIAAMVVLIATFSVSYSHIFDAASVANGGTHGHNFALMAEFAVLAIVLTQQVLFRDASKPMKALMYTGLAGSLALAFGGNITSVMPNDFWTWLVALISPTLTLVMAFIGERFLLRRQVDVLEWETQISEAQVAYDEKLLGLENSNEFMNSWANAIMAELRNMHKNAGKRTQEYNDFFAMLSEDSNIHVKRYVIKREMGRLEWFTMNVTSPNLTEPIEIEPPVERDGEEPELEMGVTVPRSRTGEQLLGVHLNAGPFTRNDGSPTDRKMQFMSEARQYPQLLNIYTTEQLSAWYAISTGSVSNARQLLIEEGLEIELS